MNKNKKLIIINYNGPLVDSFENTMNLTRFEFPNISEQEVRDFYDKNIFTSLKEYGKIAVSEKELETYFTEIHHPAQDKLEMITGMREFFENISPLADFAINSSGNKSVIEKTLTRFDIADYFINVLDKHDSASKENKFETILHLSEKSADEVFYITDKIGDMHEAQKAGLKVVLVTWGYQKKEHLEKSAQNVYGIVDTAKELEVLIKKYLS